MAHKVYPQTVRKELFKILNDNLTELLIETKKSALQMSQELVIDPDIKDTPEYNKENHFGNSFISDIISGKTMPSLEALYVIVKTYKPDIINTFLKGDKGARRAFNELLTIAIEQPKVYQRMLVYCKGLKEGRLPGIIEKQGINLQ